MTYVIANPCGNAAKFDELLRKIRFSESDLLYVIGNVADYGPDPIGLIEDLSVRPNVYPVAGEHDYLAAQMLSEFERMNAGKTPDPAFVKDMGEWVRDGGFPTMEGYRALDADAREGVLDYLSEMVLYEEAEVNGKTYILLYAGVADYEAGSDLGDYLPDDFFSEPLSKERRLFPNAIAIVGGVPTESGKIERGEGSFFLDCGVKDGGSLAALCLETGEEFYV